MRRLHDQLRRARSTPALRDDLTRRDSVMIKNQYGPNAEVAGDRRLVPAGYHYYTTYLAQFRAYPTQSPYPADQTWRTLEVQLNQAMQDPFIPGDMLKPGDRQVTLQIAETEAEPKTGHPIRDHPAADSVCAGSTWPESDTEARSFNKRLRSESRMQDGLKSGLRDDNMYPWRRIVIPTDFSTAAEWSFDSAVQLAGRPGRS